MKPGITAHVMIRDEPLAYYAVMSIYDFVDRILLWDTGTDDPLCLDGLSAVVDGDHAGKIDFRVIKQVNMQGWVHARWFHASEREPGLGVMRQQQIDATDTEFFFLVDGDEVHYKHGASAIRDSVLPNWPEGKLACYLPQRWHSHPNQTHVVGPLQGRIFKTEHVLCRGRFPGEMHCDKSDNSILWGKHPKSFAAQIPQFCHFEMFVKPWRRTMKHIRRFGGQMPEVMQNNPVFLDRFIAARGRGEYMEPPTREYDSTKEEHPQ